MLRRVFVLSALCLMAACGDNKSPTAPTPTPTPTPQPTSVSLTGQVTASTGGGIGNATVIITDGANAGRQTTTSASGSYRFDNLTPSNANVFARADGYFEDGKGVYINGTNSLSFTLNAIPRPLYSRAGRGNDVFDMPTAPGGLRVRIYGRWSGRGTSNFIVYVGGRLVVNSILRDRNPYEGVHQVSGGRVEIVSSENVEEWRIIEER